jgi:hypothetical protein
MADKADLNAAPLARDAPASVHATANSRSSSDD